MFHAHTYGVLLISIEDATTKHPHLLLKSDRLSKIPVVEIRA